MGTRCTRTTYSLLRDSDLLPVALQLHIDTRLWRALTSGVRYDIEDSRGDADVYISEDNEWHWCQNTKMVLSHNVKSKSKH